MRMIKVVPLFSLLLASVPATIAAFSTPSLHQQNDRFPEECILADAGDDSDGRNTEECLAGYTIKQSITKVFVADIQHLPPQYSTNDNIDNSSTDNNRILFYKQRKRHAACMVGPNKEQQPCTHQANIPYKRFVSNDDYVLLDTVLQTPRTNTVSLRAFHLAGPRQRLHFQPRNVNAAIVTCGGLCPGLNNVIRELVHSLYYLYGANKVYGITGGFHGFHNNNTSSFPTLLLTNQMVENIHHEGGTILRSSRGGFDIDKIISFLKEKDIHQLYIIGGDGTHRGALEISQACLQQELNIAVAGIPKTIDNDLDYMDRSFGFSSAVEAAQAGIRTAKTEAMCNVPNGIGLVKLMGRSAGFLAAFAALGSGDVDLVLVPEVPIVLDGQNGILPFLRSRVKEQGFAVVVVAEGAGEDLVGISSVLDAGGNRALPKIGEFIQKAITNHFEGFGEVANVKYIDPSYTVRSVPANGADSLYCMQLAQNAVHGAMAGMTGFSVGLVNNAIVYLPIHQLVATSPRSMNPYGTTWERILAMTGQPDNVPPKMPMNNEMEIDVDGDIQDFDPLEPTLP